MLGEGQTWHGPRQYVLLVSSYIQTWFHFWLYSVSVPFLPTDVLGMYWQSSAPPPVALPVKNAVHKLLTFYTSHTLTTCVLHIHACSCPLPVTLAECVCSFMAVNIMWQSYSWWMYVVFSWLLLAAAKHWMLPYAIFVLSLIQVSLLHPGFGCYICHYHNI